MNITNDIKYIGVDDRDIDLFEGLYDVPNGMAYNSFVIMDEKTAVFDTVDARFGELWLKNLEEALEGKSPDFLIVQHMEPDHSSNIAVFAEKFPSAKIVASKQAFVMMKQFFGTDFADRQIVAGEGSTLELGKHVLTFITAPMVHWPEVIMTYDAAEKALFSADAFGKFGARNTDEDWACEARRYYFGIVGKFGVQVQAVLKKAAALEIEKILPLHGPFLTENLGYYLDLYNTWSSYGVESEGVVIAYTSVYGHTKAAAELLAKRLEEKGCPKVAVTDLARDDMAEAVEDAFRYGKLVLATTTYNMEIFPFMKTFIDNLTERNFQNRKLAIIENGTWAPTAAKIIKGMFENSKNIEFLDTITIRSAMTPENEEQIASLAEKLI
ncbi:MAG: FprA family A-type flavoprotein [Oscillospiraceae bacterium]|nr:FprA family A-type flavoprotein [Oscillospiraceae bacterium]